MLERELKVVWADDAELPDLTDAVPGAVLGPPETDRVEDRYIDTADHRLARWGVTLRWRRGTGWTLKLPTSDDGDGVRGGLSREELLLPGRPGPLPPRAAAIVSGYTRNQPLVAVAVVAKERTARRWRRPDGTEVAELTDDRVTGTRLVGGATGEDREVCFREVEVELLDGADPALLAPIAERLAVDGAAPVQPKLVRVVGAVAAGPPDVVVPPLQEAPTGGDVIRVALASSVRQLLRHLPGVHLDREPEGVHQARVATRRLRSDLKTFAPLLAEAGIEDLRAELAWLGTELGRVRDADVLHTYLHLLLAAHPEIEPTGAAAVLQLLTRQRQADLGALTRDLVGPRALALLDRLVVLAGAPPLAPEADGPAAEVLTPLVAGSWRRLRRHVHRMDDPPTDEALHRTRILAKRVRYAAEAAGPAVPRRAARFARHAARIQGLLGDQHDAVVASHWLATHATTLRGPGAFAAGRLAQVATIEAGGGAGNWHRHYAWLRQHDDWLRP